MLEFAQCSWQGEKLYDPDWRLSVQQRRWLAAWKTDCLTAELGVWWWFVPLPKVAKVSMVALSMMKTLFVATPRQSCSAVQEILLEKQRHLQMVLDLCLALPLLCQHSHNIGHRQVSSAWPIKAHRNETWGKGGLPSQSHQASNKRSFPLRSHPCHKRSFIARPKQQWIAILHHSEVGPPDVWSEQGRPRKFPCKTRSPWFIYASFLFTEWEPRFWLYGFQLWAGSWAVFG